nr:fructose PTS transporter subunit IIA [Clostridium paraputrificum]
MTLKDIIDEKIIDLEMNCKDKDEALRTLSKNLLDAGYINDLDQFVSDIYKREEIGITGIGNHIAIPHGQSNSVEKIGIAIGRLKEDIKWESIDDEDINLIFLFCVSNNTEYARNHLLLLSEVAGKLGNDKIISALQNVREKEELIKVLTE